MALTDGEIKTIAAEMYWSHSDDVSQYSEEDGKAILKELGWLEHIEEEANERWFKCSYRARLRTA